jgi:DNA-binding transcriptional LysR family regulator
MATELIISDLVVVGGKFGANEHHLTTNPSRMVLPASPRVEAEESKPRPLETLLTINSSFCPSFDQVINLQQWLDQVTSLKMEND